MDVPAKEWMSGDPVAVEADASALEALDLMVDRGIRHLPVVDGERRVVGVLSVEDLRAALPFSVSPRHAPDPEERARALEWNVGDVMTHAPLTIREETAIAEAAEKMADQRLGCLPVVDAEGRLAGLLSETDLLHALATSLWSDEVRERRSRKSELELLVEELWRERASLAAQLDGYHAQERELSADLNDGPRDEVDRSKGLLDLGVTQTLDDLAFRRFRALDHALDRAGQGRLGVCEDCGGSIPVARLRALPGTTRCVACARRKP